MGVRTARSERQARLKVDHPHQAHAEDYQPTPIGLIEDILSGLDLELADHTFIDLGAGKGRVLFLAAAFGFRRIVGVELAPALAADCRANVAAFDAPWARCRAIDVIEGDAAAYRFPAGPLVVYLFNPFRALVMRKVIDRLAMTYAEAPRSISVIYYMPVHRRHFDHHPHFAVVDEARDWVVYRLRDHRT